jgi:TolB-like protein
MSAAFNRRGAGTRASPHAGNPSKDLGRLPQTAAIPHDVKKAIDYMRAHIHREVTVPELAQFARVTERTLRKHFQSFLGRSPAGYWRCMRLGGARDELLVTTKHGSISEIAARYGFHHLGRFAAEYRRCFGESPSTTLHRVRNAGTQATIHDNASAEPHRSDSQSMWRVSRERPSLVILPLEISTTNQRFFADSLAEVIACALCRIRSLAVSTSISLLRSARLEAHKQPSTNRARYALTGRIVQDGDRVRVTVGLLDLASTEQVWGDCYEGRATKLLLLQDRVTQGIMRAVMPNIWGAEIERVRRKRPENLGAYDLTMRAFPLASAASPSAARQALDLLTRAMELAPDYALPAAIAGWCHGQLVTYSGTSSIAQEKAIALAFAERARVLDADDDPLVITARCAVHTMFNDFDTGAFLLERVLAADPTSSWAWERSGWLNLFSGRSAVAARHFKRAIRFAPAPSRNALRYIGIGSACFDLGKYEEAARWKRKAMLEEPGTAWVNRTLAVTYARLGDRSAARRSLETFQRCCPDVTIRQVISAAPFKPEFWKRVAEGLDDLGLPL